MERYGSYASASAGNLYCTIRMAEPEPEPEPGSSTPAVEPIVVPETAPAPDAAAQQQPPQLEPEPEQRPAVEAASTDDAAVAATARQARAVALDAGAEGAGSSDAEREAQLQEAARLQARSRLENTIQDTISALRATLSEEAFARCQPTRDRLQRPKLAFLYRIVSTVSAETGFGRHMFEDEVGRLALEAVSGKAGKPPTAEGRVDVSQRKLL